MGLEIRINKTFLKELSRLPSNQREKIENFVFNDMECFETKEDIPNLKKTKGVQNVLPNQIWKLQGGNQN